MPRQEIAKSVACIRWLFDAASTESGLQRALDCRWRWAITYRCSIRYSYSDTAAAACDTAGMKTSTVKTEVLYASRNPNRCLLQVNGAVLKQVPVWKFKYRWTGHGMEWKIEWKEISVWNMKDARMEWNGRFQEWNGRQSAILPYQFHTRFGALYLQKNTYGCWVVINNIVTEVFNFNIYA